MKNYSHMRSKDVPWGISLITYVQLKEAHLLRIKEKKWKTLDALTGLFVKHSSGGNRQECGTKALMDLHVAISPKSQYSFVLQFENVTLLPGLEECLPVSMHDFLLTRK